MRRPSSCRQCGAPDSDVGRISRRGLCTNCATENMNANQLALADRSSPAYAEWLAKTRAAQAEYWQNVEQFIDERWRAAEQAHTETP